MTISLRIKDEESQLIKAYAKLHNQSLSEFIRLTILERIEDEFDLQAYLEAKQEYEKDPHTFTLDEVEQELGLK